MGNFFRVSLIFALGMRSAKGQSGISNALITSASSSISPTSSSMSSPNSYPGSDLTVFASTWTIPDQVLDSPTSIKFYISPPVQPWTGNLTLVLCQTSASDIGSITETNSWSVEQLPRCPSPSVSSPCSYDYYTNTTLTSYWSFERANGNGDILQNFFFCFGIFSSDSITNFQCASSSPLFNISSQHGLRSRNSRRAINQETLTPMAVVPITQNKEIIYYLGGPAPSATTSITGTSYSAVTLASSTGAPAASPTATQTSTSAVKESASKSSLSVGAKAGIALGALALFALLLLLALFFLRRKHSKRATEHHQPEQVMLTRSMHTDSFGRPAIITEKEEAISSAAVLNRAGDLQVHSSGGGGIPEVALPAPAPVPQTRHTVLSPYDPIPSAPYTGTIGTSNDNKNNIPRRKPTATTMASTVSRGLSTASSVSAGPISPRSAHTGSGTTASGSGEFEAYHDVRVYGDARHVPQVFSATRIPFLGEETQGMSPEEVARLEEEERRIDLAIAEAERR